MDANWTSTGAIALEGVDEATRILTELFMMNHGPSDFKSISSSRKVEENAGELRSSNKQRLATVSELAERAFGIESRSRNLALT